MHISRIKNIIMMLWEKAFKLLFSLIWVAYLSRLVGPEDFGEYSYLFAIITLFSMLPLFGMENVVIKGLVERDNGILISALYIRLFFSIFSAFFVFFTFTVGELQNVNYAFCISLLIFLALTSELIKNFYQSKEDAKKYVVIDNCAIVVSFIVKMYLTENGNRDYLILISLDYVLTFIFVAIVFKFDSNRERLSLGVNLKKISYVFKQSFPFFISTLMVVIYSKVDQLMIKDMLGYQELGYYSAALRISSSWWVIPTTLILSLYPILIAQYNKNKNEEIAACFFSICTFISLLIGTLVFVLSDSIVYAVFGEKYIAASEIIKAHCFIGCLASLGVARSKWLIIKGLQKWIPLFIFLGMILNIAGNYILINYMGLIGAVLSTLISQLAVLVVFPFLVKSTRDSVFLIIKSFSPNLFIQGLDFFIFRKSNSFERD